MNAITHPPLRYVECSIDRPDNGHFCQIYQQESGLVDAVVRYLRIGIANGENLILITRKQRQNRVLDWLMAKNVDVPALRKNAQLFVYSSSELIDHLMPEGALDWHVFESACNSMLAEASQSGTKRLRVYGDAANELWQAGKHAVAIQLEEFWNHVIESRQYDASVFCGYVIDALNPESYSEHLQRLGREHCFVPANNDDLALRCALDEASQQVLGVALSSSMTPTESPTAWQNRLPLAFRTAMWLQQKHPAAMARVLSRAKELYLGSKKETV